MKDILINNLAVLIVIVPLFIAFILPTLSRHRRLVENLVFLVGITELALSLTLASLLQKQGGAPIIYSMGGWKAPWGIEVLVGNLAVFFLIAISFITLFISLYARNNLVDEIGDQAKSTRFYVLYLLLTGALAGMAITNDIFNIFVLVEVATLSCCGLVAASKSKHSPMAAFRYLILATLGSSFVLGGIGFLYVITGHLNISFIGAELALVWQASPHVVWLALSFFLVGFGVKSALFPLHIWLPDAHAIAPSPASAILSSLAVKGYIICLLKILYNIFGPSLMVNFKVNRFLPLVAMIAILAASIYALKEKELKRRLAYSTVAQVGYIYLGFSLLTEAGFTGSLFYLASHALIKATLFLAAGALVKASGKKYVHELAGLGKKMPITMGAFTIASFALVGIPLFSGFVGKWYLLLGSLEANSILGVMTIILGSILCAFYLFPIIKTAYFSEDPLVEGKDPGWAQKISLIALSLAIILLGTFPSPLLKLAKKAALDFLVLQ